MKTFIYLFVIAVLIASCKKNELGGKSMIRGKVAHHSKAIGNATVYIKFDAQEFPGSDPSKYDAQVKADVTGNYEIPEIYKGEYYLYAVGEDLAIPPPYQVVGGVPVKIRHNETLTADIPVTEGD